MVVLVSQSILANPILESNEDASQFLSKAKQGQSKRRRMNIGHFEELYQTHDLERECFEEICTKEEAHEAFENRKDDPNHEQDFLNFWKPIGDLCSVEDRGCYTP